MESVSILQVTVAALVGYVSWYFLKPYVVRSSLDSIPGPPRQSWFTGTSLSSSCHNVWMALLISCTQGILGNFSAKGAGTSVMNLCASTRAVLPSFTDCLEYVCSSPRLMVHPSHTGLG